MGLRIQMVKCKNCGRQLEDTGQDEFTCHYCGKKTYRDIAADQELMDQKKTVILLNADVKWQKTAYKTLMGGGIGILALSMVFLFAEKFVFEVLLSFAGLMLMGFVVLVSGILVQRRYRKNNSKLQDLTGGRGIIMLK